MCMLYFGHMLDMAGKAYAKTQGITRLDYDNDENLRLAAVRSLLFVVRFFALRAKKRTTDAIGSTMLPQAS